MIKTITKPTAALGHCRGLTFFSPITLPAASGLHQDSIHTDWYCDILNGLFAKILISQDLTCSSHGQKQFQRYKCLLLQIDSLNGLQY